MGRKVALIGPSTLMISLPSKWVKQQSIKKGDELEVIEEKNKLIIANQHMLSSTRKTSIDIQGLNTSLAWYCITAAYRSGTEEIQIKTSSPTIRNESLQKDSSTFDFVKSITDNCIGMEIIKNNNEQFVIKEISAIKEGEFDTMQRRIFFSLKNTFDDIVSAIKKRNNNELEHIFLYNDINVNKFADYCLRILARMNSSHQTAYAVIIYLEEIGDSLKYLARQLSKVKVSSEVIQLLSNLKELFTLVERFYYNNERETLVEFEKQKRDMRKQILSLTKSTDPGSIMMVSKIANQSLAIIHARLLQG